MDREAIERRDFPVGRRGYDQAAVDAHLRRVADELERLRARPATPLAADASEQVRAILEAAEAGAAQLREDAGRRAGEHAQRVEEAAGVMLSRLDDLERELGGLLDALRRSGERLTEGLARLHEQVGEAGGTAPPDEEDFAGAAPAAADESAAGTTAAGESVGDTAAEERMPAEPAEADGRAGGDEAGARLIALNMALSGTPREETARYLAEHFRLEDAGALLDDVYARAGR